jgi:eukaryotic-like serine/threonine-protein kinase
MTAERWQRVGELYQAALMRDEGARAAFLAEACAGDEALRREVESLLTQRASAEGFLDGPAVAIAAPLISDVGASVLTGRRLGAYQVKARIGVGGMGEVYRARDATLGRDVAIKVLSRAFNKDPERLARFQREARLLAALNHPNIATIYGVENAPGEGGTSISALVMELVEGETLAERIVRAGESSTSRGPRTAIPIAETLSIARQVADALDAAHDKGIVHRDLKPANIKITPTGVVKVLDFGLAKAGGDDAAPDLTQSPTITVGGTYEGVIVGTAAYMSPEQARGQAVDKRTDIWAFGCVLYEMLTGRATFARDTVTDTLAAIVEREPDWTVLPTLPSTLTRLLHRCLEKDIRRRLHDIADARIEIDDAVSISATAVVAPPAPGSRTTASVAAFVVGSLVTALAATFVGKWIGSRTVADAPGPSFSRILRLTSGPAREWAPAISPDGKWVAYLSNARGPTDVWVKFVAGGEPANLTASTGLEVTPGTGIGGIDISPDGTRIAVMARMRGTTSPNETWEIPAPLPGAPRKLLAEFVGLRWSPDGRLITFIRSGGSAGDALWVANADGTNRREIIPIHPGRHIHWPTWSRDGYIYFIDTNAPVVNMEPSGISRINPDQGKIEPIVTTLRRAIFPLPMPDGNGLIYAANPTTAELGLWWRPPDGGLARPLTSGIGEYAEPRISADGKTLVGTLYDVHQSLIRVDVGQHFGAMKFITEGYTGDLDPTVDPIIDRLVFSSSRTGIRHLWTARLDGSDARPLTSGAWLDERPAISPDGQQIAFVSDRDGTRALWLMNPDGGAPRKLLNAEITTGLSWSRDGREITFAAPAGERKALWAASVANGQLRQIPTPEAEAVGDSADSPTRDLIAYIAATTTGRSQSRLAFVDSAGHPRGVTSPPSENGVLAWAPDGKRLAVVAQGSDTPSIWIVEPDAPNPTRKLIEFPGGPRIRGIAWVRSGDAIIIGKHDMASSDIVLLDSGK